VTPKSTLEYLASVCPRYLRASRPRRSALLDEICATTGYHRKSAIRALAKAAAPAPGPVRRGRPRQYHAATVNVLETIWAAAGYPWSARLRALLPLWVPAASRRMRIPPIVARQLQTISAATIDRRLRSRKRTLKRRQYGRTKPGTLLKHHIALKTDHWDVTTPGFTEMDLVAHSGNSADGLFCQSLNLTDIHTGWVESRAIMGKGQRAVRAALEDLRQALPCALQGVDSDNGSEFINTQLLQYCQAREIRFTRGRPYKKDDNAHIEQKNWTHVRKLLGYDRFDSSDALAALNDLYRHELRLMMNLFQPSVKLREKHRVGARVTRRYDRACTPLDRMLASDAGHRPALEALQQLRATLDPFALAETIDRKLHRIFRLANHRLSPPVQPASPAAPPRPVPIPHRRSNDWFFLTSPNGSTAAKRALSATPR